VLVSSYMDPFLHMKQTVLSYIHFTIVIGLTVIFSVYRKSTLIICCQVNLSWNKYAEPNFKYYDEMLVKNCRDEQEVSQGFDCESIVNMLYCTGLFQFLPSDCPLPHSHSKCL